MPSAPSRFEVEHLRRLMLKASIEAAQLDERVDQARKDDSLWPALHHWSDAAESLEEAVERARPELQQDGTPKEQIDRIRERLGGLEQRSKRFDLDYDLDFCVDAWTSLGHELAQLSGRRRDPLVRLLELRKPAIDQTTAMLSEACSSSIARSWSCRRSAIARARSTNACARRGSPHNAIARRPNSRRPRQRPRSNTK